MKKMILGPASFQSTYCREEGIVYDQQPDEEWQWMATGTGRMGVAVIASDPLIIQINHEGAFTERGYMTHLARLTLHMDGCPLSCANHEKTFRMRHDIKTSRIVITTPYAEITIFAGMESQIAAVEWRDLREVKLGGALSISVPYIANNVNTEDTMTFWHENGAETTWHQINVSSGMPEDGAFEDPLKDRVFGLSVRAEDELMQGNGWKIIPKEVHRFYIAADAGKGAFADKVASESIYTAKWDVLMAEHLRWFEQFWDRVHFECDDDKMSSFVAAYDLYRYFTAVSCGKDREFPTRFQIPILSARTTGTPWTSMQISSVQTIQAYFGIVRNGDWDQLASFENDYRNKEEIYKAYTKALLGYEGMIIPYETNIWGTAHYHKVGRGNGYKDENEYSLYYLPKHIYATYTYEHGLGILCMLWDAARARGEEDAFAAWALEQMEQMLLFFYTRYVQADGSMIFDPATTGETWYNCKNPASWIVLFRVRLPEIWELAQRYGNEKLYDLAQKIYNGLPALPKGAWRIGEGRKVELLPCNPGEEVLLPAEEFNRYGNINAENPELYTVWPYGYYGIGKEDYDLALRTFRRREWAHHNVGWQLDGIWAACLGLTEEAYTLAKEQIDWTIRCPGGFSYEEAPIDLKCPSIPHYPSMQGMGNTVCALYEMLCHDDGDRLIILPAWPKDVSVSVVIYTASGGRTEIRHEANGETVCYTEKEVDKWYV